VQGPQLKKIFGVALRKREDFHAFFCYSSTKMKSKQFVIKIFLFGFLFLLISSLNQVVEAQLLFKPYLGLAQSTINLGDSENINGNMNAYILGLRVGIPITQAIYIGADYSRAGPYEYTVISRYQNIKYPKIIFNVFSGGFGVGIDTARVTFWGGVYSYHVVDEYNLGFRFSGPLKRFGMGLRVGKELELQIFSDTAELKSTELSNGAENLLCENSTCEAKGKLESMTFAIGAIF
jgi:hypothetical protein